MFYKIRNFLFLLIFFVYISFICIYYISDENKKKIYLNRLTINDNKQNKDYSIPFLKNDTNNVIDYFSSELEEKKIKKRYFWELFKK
mgnify:CR=1 FL=1|tara:strand:+ start:423 stop:683 length:261 start_codon:yes stop_codon:yes gene_type:complete